MHRAGRARRLAAARQPGESHDEDEQPEADDCEACPLRWLYLAVAKVAQLGRPGEIVALLHRFPLCAAVVAARRWCDSAHTTIHVSFSMLAQARLGTSGTPLALDRQPSGSHQAAGSALDVVRSE